MLGARQILVGPFFPVKEFLSQIIYEIHHIKPAGDKWRIDPRRYSFSVISLIAVYLRGSIRHLSPAGLIWYISYIICDKKLLHGEERTH